MARGLEVGHVAADTLCLTRLAISPNGQSLASGGGIHQALVDGVWTQRKDGDFDIRLWRLPESVWPDPTAVAAQTLEPSTQPPERSD